MEKYFGINKFRSARQAFDVMCGYFGDEVGDYPNITILDSKSFKKKIANRVIDALVKLKCDDVELKDWEKKHYQHMLYEKNCDNLICDAILDFNFFLYCEENKSFYTGRMSFKDDGVTTPNEKQWDVIRELFDKYDIIKIMKDTEDYFNDVILVEYKKEIREDNGDVDDDDMYYDFTTMCDLIDIIATDFLELPPY